MESFCLRGAQELAQHIEQVCNVPMYRTSIECEPAGRMSGPLVEIPDGTLPVFWACGVTPQAGFRGGGQES
ncbi:hypothetical protein HMPREF3175_08040 [Arthrobacter sp. HMSC08H08]|nr:hypothetical protein HMPREF3175_08040 [Arthrobacter sp. HMSC08H08]